MFQKRIILHFNLFFLFISLLTACGADSPLVHILGKDMKNFVDKTVDQKEPATLTGEYLFLYLEEPDSSSNKPGVNKDKVRLHLKNSVTGQVETIFNGISGNDIKYGFILPETHTILFTMRHWGSEDCNTYLYAYDYKKRELRQKGVVFEPNKYRNKKLFPGGSMSFLDEMVLCEKHTSICTKIEYEINQKQQYAYDYYNINIETGIRETIDEQTFNKLISESRMDSAVRYESMEHGKKIWLFSVYQYHDRIRENPKPKYNGIYINDGKNNIRISRLDGYELLKSKPIWVNDDRKVIIGRYLVDIEGKQKETTIIDGEMLYAVPVPK